MDRDLNASRNILMKSILESQGSEKPEKSVSGFRGPPALIIFQQDEIPALRAYAKEIVRLIVVVIIVTPKL